MRNLSLTEKRLKHLKIIITLILLITLVNNKLQSQDELDVITNKWLHYSDAPNSLYHYLTDQAIDLLDKRKSSLAEIKTLAEWQQRQKWVNLTLMDILGPFPEKTPLNAKIIREIEKKDFKVEHIVFESQTGFYVTSSLFIPGELKKKSKAPCVIYCSGHTLEGYRNTAYQHIILNLVKKGFIVFAFDPIGQGERLEYYDAKTKKSVIGRATKEHSYSGTQAFVTGSSEARYFTWDGIRAVDYLLTRKEVDPDRIGITGRSGGGTQSAYIAAVDKRIYASAPENWVTNCTRLFQSIGPQDAEQNLFNSIKRGIDHADLIIARAPKPTLMITNTRDFFSIQGAMETEEEVLKIYKAYGKAENFGRVEDDFPHQSTKKNREAMYLFFQKHLNNPGNPNDEETQSLSVEDMRVTTTGQISTSLASETVFSLNKKETEKLLKNLKESRNDISGHLSIILSSAKKLSGYREPVDYNAPVFTGRFQRDNYVIEKYFVKGEGDYIIPYLLLIPDRPNNKAIIYLHPLGKSAEAHEGGEIEWFVRQGFTVMAPDLIGVGEMGPGIYHGDAYIEGVSNNLWYASMLIGRSIVGIRAGDVVRLSQLLIKNKEIMEVYGFARREMAPVLLHAASFEKNITNIALIEPYSSYASIVSNRFYNSLLIHSAVPGALECYDLPDLAASLAPRKLLIAGSTDGTINLNSIDSSDKVFDIIYAGYHFRNADNQLNINSQNSSGKLYNNYLEWIK